MHYILAGSDTQAKLTRNESQLYSVSPTRLPDHLNYIETKAFRVPIRVYATPDQDIEHGRFSLDLAARTLAFYEKAFDNEFPLPKMDMVAVPEDQFSLFVVVGISTFATDCNL
ncbi:aminopeptidase 2 mitochondrial [Aspergillus niger]|nr:aminopeptidase 2 mitochondrial [Aspergillus niger]